MTKKWQKNDKKMTKNDKKMTKNDKKMMKKWQKNNKKRWRKIGPKWAYMAKNGPKWARIRSKKWVKRGQHRFLHPKRARVPRSSISIPGWWSRGMTPRTRGSGGGSVSLRREKGEGLRWRPILDWRQPMARMHSRVLCEPPSILRGPKMAKMAILAILAHRWKKGPKGSAN